MKKLLLLSLALISLISKYTKVNAMLDNEKYKNCLVLKLGIKNINEFWQYDFSNYYFYELEREKFCVTFETGIINSETKEKTVFPYKIVVEEFYNAEGHVSKCIIKNVTQNINEE